MNTNKHCKVYNLSKLNPVMHSMQVFNISIYIYIYIYTHIYIYIYFLYYALLAFVVVVVVGRGVCKSFFM